MRLKLRTRHPSCRRHLSNINVRGNTVYRHGSITQTNHPQEINSVQSVLNSKDKLRMKQLFDGPHNPDYYFFKDNLWYFNNGEEGMTREQLLANIKFPVLTKLQYRSRGQGMAIHLDATTLLPELDDIKLRYIRGRNQKYIERYHNYAYEFGIHVALDECVYACRKARLTGHSEYYRNDSNSCWFTQFDDLGNLKENFNQPSTWDAIVEECNRLRKLVGLDITRMDVIVTKSGKFKVLECNSAPSIAEGTAYYYSTALPKIVNKKYYVQ